MPPACSYEKCPRSEGAKWLSFGQKAKPILLFDRPYCSRDCLRWGVSDVLRGELDRFRRSKSDIKKSKLGSILVADNVITREQLDVALKLQQWTAHKPLGECLIELGYISRDQLTYYISQQERIPYIRAEQIRIDPNLPVAIPPAIARVGGLMPYDFDPFSREMSIACLAPINKDACISVGKIAGVEYLPFLVENAMFNEIFRMYESMFSGLNLYSHADPYPLKQAMDVFGLTDVMFSVLMMEEDETISLAFIKENAWVRILIRGYTYHYLFPLTISV